MNISPKHIAVYSKRHSERNIPALAKHAEKKANPLYPVPILLTRKEVESFYDQVADWSKANDKRTNKKSA